MSVTKRRSPKPGTRPIPLIAGVSDLIRLPTEAAVRYIRAAPPELIRSGERGSILGVAAMIHNVLRDQVAAHGASMETRLVLSRQTGR